MLEGWDGIICCVVVCWITGRGERFITVISDG